MRRLKYLFIVIFSIFLLASCSNSSKNGPRTIELSVDSKIIPTFTANYGSGTYDEVNKKYTHNVDFVKDLYIYLSKENYKTEIVEIKATEMVDSIIKKDVKFGNRIPCSVKLTFGEVEDISDITYDTNYVINPVIKNNVLSFEYPDKNDERELIFKKSGYKDIKLSLTKENMISGSYDVTLPLLTADEIAVTFVGGYEYGNYQYLVCDMNNNIVSSGTYSSRGKKYVLLDKEKEYYFVNKNNNNVIKLPKGEDYIISFNEEENRNNIFIDFRGDFFGNIIIVNKEKNQIINNNYVNSIDNLMLIIYNNNDEKVKVIEDLKSKLVIENNDKSDNTRYVYNYNNDDFSEFDIEGKVVSKINGEEINDYYFNEVTFDYIKIEDNKLKFSGKSLYSASCSVNLVDKNNNIVTKINTYISSNMKDSYISGIDESTGKPMAYSFPLFIKDLIYNSVQRNYTYPDQIVDTTKTYVKIIDSDFNNMSVNLVDKKGNRVERTDSGYYEVTVDTTYTYSDYNSKEQARREITITEDDINNGFVVIGELNVNTIIINVPSNLKISIDSYSSLLLTKESNTQYKLLARKDVNNAYLRISNKYVTISHNFNISDINTIDINQFIARPINLYSLYYDSSDGNNGIWYYYPVDYSNTEINKVQICGENYTANCIFDENLDANIVDVCKTSPYIIIKVSNEIYVQDYVDSIFVDGYNYYFISNSKTKVTIDGNSIDIPTDGEYFIYNGSTLVKTNLKFE